jgi:hypothetical protein
MVGADLARNGAAAYPVSGVMTESFSYFVESI